jgi:hypothetical protein
MLVSKRPHRFYKVFKVLATFLQMVYALLFVFNIYQVISASASDVLPGAWKSIVVPLAMFGLITYLKWYFRTYFYQKGSNSVK